VVLLTTFSDTQPLSLAVNYSLLLKQSEIQVIDETSTSIFWTCLLKSAGFNCIKSTGEIKGHDPDSASSIVQMRVGLAKQVDDRIQNDKKRVVYTERCSLAYWGKSKHSF